jgi:hypothetical protein
MFRYGLPPTYCVHAGWQVAPLCNDGAVRIWISCWVLVCQLLPAGNELHILEEMVGYEISNHLFYIQRIVSPHH